MSAEEGESDILPDAPYRAINPGCTSADGQALGESTGGWRRVAGGRLGATRLDGLRRSAVVGSPGYLDAAGSRSRCESGTVPLR
jgi:hypothetical protein